MKRLRMQSHRTVTTPCLPLLLCILLLSGISNHPAGAFNLAFTSRMTAQRKRGCQSMVSRSLDEPKTAVDIIIERQETSERVDFQPDEFVLNNQKSSSP